MWVSPTTGTLTAYGPGVVTYDALDRMTSTSSGTNVYGDAHHLHAQTSMGGGYSASYDAAGNMTCRSTSSSSQCTTSSQNGQIMAYDAAGRMIAWQNAPSSPTSTQAMAYDGEGNRVALAVTGGTPSITSGSSKEISGSSVTKYFAGGSGLPTAERVGTGGAISYLASDGLGSLDMALDSSGHVTAQQLFFPYGRPFYSSGSMPTAKGFTGQRADNATSGLVYLNARYYDYVGRAFLSADTANDGLNRYAYAHWNPETLTDPTGHYTTCAPGTDLCNGKCVVCGSPTPTPPTTPPPPPPGCQATGDCPPPPPPPAGCQATGDCPGASIGSTDGNIVLDADLWACDAAMHPAWCDKYYDYSPDLSYAFDGNDGLLKRPWQDLMGIADFWILTAGFGALIAGLYAEVYYIPSVGQWWSPQGAVISYGGWAGLSLGFDETVAVGFGLLFTRYRAASVEELRDFLAGPSTTHEQDYGLHGWTDASNSAGYSWEFHVGVFAAGANGGLSCGLLGIFSWPPQVNACPLP